VPHNPFIAVHGKASVFDALIYNKNHHNSNHTLPRQPLPGPPNMTKHITLRQQEVTHNKQPMSGGQDEQQNQNNGWPSNERKESIQN
jgi:hypothetical protein